MRHIRLGVRAKLWTVLIPRSVSRGPGGVRCGFRRVPGHRPVFERLGIEHHTVADSAGNRIAGCGIIKYSALPESCRGNNFAVFIGDAQRALV